MAHGTVNAQGATGPELEAVKKIAYNAMDTADAALKKIGEYTNVIQSLPVQSNILTYNGGEQEPKWSGYNPEIMDMEGYEAKTAAGSYDVTFTPKEGYRWWDGETEGKAAQWIIARQPTSTPSQSNSLTYNETEQEPTWDNFDGDKLTIGGVLKGTNAGDYYAEFTPKDNYCFADGQATAKHIKWAIGRAAGSLELSKSAVTISGGVATATVTATVLGDGIVTAKSDNDEAVTVTVGEDNSTVTITALKTGTAYITVHAAAGTNYDSPADKTVYVNAEVPSVKLEENTPEMIQAVARAGQARNYWNAGDRVPIALKGKVGALSLNGTYYAVIIGFDHNADIEGNNSIHFQFGQAADGTNIAFVDSKYYSQNSEAGFRMNPTDITTGGWKSSYMRTVICPAFLSAMSKEWQNVIAACVKYSDNTGDGADTASNVTKTSDKIWLLAEYEVQGVRKNANSKEQSYQKQYEFYANGNSALRYRHDDTNSVCYWWLRTPTEGYSTTFCGITISNVSASAASVRIGIGPDGSLGFAPGFMVA